MESNESNHRLFIGRMVAFRKNRKMSQAKLAELCDVSNGTIGNIECGVTKPSFDLIFKIAESLNIRAKDLFDFETPIKNEEFSESQLTKVEELVESAVKGALENAKKNFATELKKYNIGH